MTSLVETFHHRSRTALARLASLKSLHDLEEVRFGSHPSHTFNKLYISERLGQFNSKKTYPITDQKKWSCRN